MILKILFVFILFIHGLIHLLGFVKEWQLAQVSQLTGATLFPLSGNISKLAGLLWLLAFILFVVSSSAYLLGQDIWWMVAFWALLISQILIIIYWPDAKFGTIANIIILVVVYLSFATAHFNQDVKSEMKSFLSKADVHSEKIVTKEMLENLPVCVQKWLVNTKMLGKKNIYTIYLKQKGELRTKMDGKWMPVEAEQVTRVEEPGFIWSAMIQAAPFLNIRGRDKYENGKGNMLIKLLSFIPIADAKGKETDQGSLLRFLGEIMWYPTAVLCDYITWEEIDSTSARATMAYGGIAASGVFKFNKDGDVVGFEADRYYDQNGKYTLEKWFVSVTDYRDFGGIRIPVEAKVTWKLKTGDFTWYKLLITEIKYNINPFTIIGEKNESF